MNNNLTLSVNLTGDGRQLSVTLKDAQGDVREFSATTERESRKAETALTAPGRSAATVSEHLRETQREARNFGTEATRGGREANQALAQTGQQAETTTNHLSSLRRMAGLAFGAFSVRQVVGMVDGWSDMQSVVGAAIGDMSEAGDMMRRITDIANASYAPLELTARTYASNVSALRDLGRSAEETADYTESLNHMLVLTATRGQQAESVQNALSRAMAVGRLQADGLETVLANGGEVAQALANQLGVTVSQLRGLATEGRITGDVIASALIGSLDDVRDRAGEMPATIEDGFVRIGTSATRLVGELDQALGTSEGVAGILIGVADALTGTIDPLINNIDTLQSGITVVGVAAGAYVTYRSVLIAATAAQWAFNTAVRANPLGLAITLLGAAAGALIAYRQEVTLAGSESYQTSLDVDGLTGSFHLLTEAQQENRRASIVGDLIEMRMEAGKLGAELVEVSRLVRNSGQLTPEGGAMPIASADDIARGRELREELGTLLANIGAGTELLTEYDAIMSDLGQTTTGTATRTRELAAASATSSETARDAAAAANELTKATEAQAAAIEALRNRLIPGRREVVQLAQDMQTLTLAMAMGTGNIAQNIQMMGLLQQQYIEAQKDTDDLAAKSEDAGSRIANSFDTWGTVADNTLRRVDDSGKDTWLGLVDGSTSALDTVKRGFQQTLAEIAHMLTTQRLTFHVAGMLGLDTTGMAGGQRGGLNVGSLKSGWDTVSGLWGGGSAASTAAAGYGAAGWAGSATGAYTGWAGSAAAGAAQAGGGLMGAASAAMPWVAGGLLVDNVLGLGITEGIVKGISSIFGGGKSDPRLNISTRGDAGQFSHDSVRSGAFGAVGFSEGTKRSNDLFGTVEAERDWLASVAAMDSMLATAARTPEQLNAMTAAVQNMVITSGDAQGAIDQLSSRSLAAVSALDADYADMLRSMGLSAEGLTARVVQAANAMQLLDSNSARLNLQFDASAAGAMRAADGMAQLMGGADNLSASLGGFYDAFYTEEEKLQHLTEDLSGTFASMGRELPNSREGVRDLVEGLQLMGTAGQEQLATILQLNQPLAQYIAAMEEQRAAAAAAGEAVDNSAESMRSLADIARERETLEMQLLRAKGNTAEIRRRELAEIDESNRGIQTHIYAINDMESAYRDFTRSLNAERQILQAAHRETTSSIQRNMQTVQAAMQRAEQASQSLNSALQQTQSGTLYAREQGQAALRAMLTAGEISDQRDLDNALAAVAEPSEGLFATFLDYQRDQARTGHTIKDLEQLAGEQLTNEERSLQALENQLTQADRQFDQEMARLDNMLAAQDALIEAEYGQFGWLETVNNSVLSLHDALAALGAARNTGGSSGRIGQGGTGAGGSVTDDDISWTIDQVRDSAGGINDAAARRLYEAALSTGTPLSRIEQQIPGAIDWVERAGLPKFKDGGISDGSISGYLAELHGREAVVPLPNGRSIPVEMRGPALSPMGTQSSDNGLLRAMNTLIKRVESLEKELASHKPYQRETADNTTKLAKEALRSRLKEGVEE